MATIRIDNTKISITNEIENMTDRILEKIEIETNGMKKYIRKQIGISRWKSKKRK